MYIRKLITSFLASLCMTVVFPAVVFPDAVSAAAALPSDAAPGQNAAASLQIPLDEYPVIDGSLACVPLCEALAVRLTGCSQAEAEDTLALFSNTNPSYISLSAGERDLTLAYEPANSTRAQLAEMKAAGEGEDLEMTPVGRDALVFLVNADNPVDSLTTQELKDIFTGKIVNWSEVGGNDAPINLFTRPESSGSQTLMDALILQGAPAAEGNTVLIPTMEGMVTAFADFDNSINAIGYSVFYYATEMMNQPGMKLIAVDGTAPDIEAIRQESYPLVHPFYCVTRENSPENALAIRDWLLSDEGQGFVEECGYVGINK